MLETESSPSNAVRERPPPRVPDHEMIRRIGEGAYGEVWLAKSAVGTHRAVKVVYRDNFKESRPYDREYRGIQKFEPISRSSEGFVDILQIGRNAEDGYFYYVMELADPAECGPEPPPPADSPMSEYSPRTLRGEILRRGRLPFDECLNFGISLALALGHLHRHGLIHRDIKPSNIVFIGGVPKLADIGLVTEVGEARTFVGTEGFIPPEGPNSPRADIYSLGKVLYEMSMGKDRLDFPEPFTALGQAPESPELEELNAVIIKACASNPRDRYQSAEELNVDLALLQSGRSVKSKRMLERRLALASRVAAVIGFFAALALAAFVYQRHQTHEAKRLQKVAEDLSTRMQIQNAENLFARGESSLAMAHLARVLRDRPRDRVAAERIMAALAQRSFPRLASPPMVHQAKFPLPPHGTAAHRVVARLSPDSRRILTICDDNSVHVWNSSTGRETIEPFKHAEAVYSAEFSPDGTKFVTASDDRTACVLDAISGRLLFPPLRHDHAVLHAAFSPNGRWIATASLDGTARVFDADSGALIRGPLAHVGPMNAVAFSPDSQRLATAMEGGRIRIWEINSGNELRRLRPDASVQHVRFSPEGTWIAASLYGGHDTGVWRVQIWNAESGAPASAPMFHQNRIYTMEFSPDGLRLVTSTANNSARVWEVQTGRELFQLRHSSIVYSATFSPDGTQILTGCVDHTARLWDARTGVELSEAMPHDGRVMHAEFSRDGSQVLTAGWEDKTVKLWNVHPGLQAVETLPHAHWVTSAEFDKNGREALVATGSLISTAANINSFGSGPDGDQILLWNLTAGLSSKSPALPPSMEAVTAQFTDAGPLALISEKTGRSAFTNLVTIWNPAGEEAAGRQIRHSEEISCARFSEDGRKLAIGGSKGAVSFWDVRRGAALTQPLAADGTLKSLRFSPNGGQLVGATVRGAVFIWDVPTGRLVAGPLRHREAVWHADFSPLGNRVISASIDFTAKAWSTNGELLATLQHRSPVEFAEFSPDGTLIVTAAGNKVLLWNAATGRQLIEPLQHSELVMSARFSQDGLRIVTACNDGSAQLWDARTGLKLADAFRHNDWVLSARFSTDGQRVITASRDRTAKIWEVQIAPSPIPAWLPELAEVIGGQRINPDRIPEPIAWNEFAEVKARVANLAGADPLAGWVRRILPEFSPAPQPRSAPPKRD